MKTTFISLVLVIFSCSCSNKEIIPKDCEKLKAQGVIDSFPYPIRPGSAEWKELKSHTEMVAAVTVPESELKTMCTQGLVYTCVYCPLFIDLLVCNHIRDCFLGLTKNINLFGELITRSDAGTELFTYYKTLFDTTKNSTRYIDVQYKIYSVETFFAQQEFLSKLTDQELNEVFTDAFSKLEYKQKYSLGWIYIHSSYYLLGNLLYYNLHYEPFINFIDRYDMEIFLYDQMSLSNQPVDSIKYYSEKYLQDNLK
jgi:hypothetical protein